jgi:hypothetical protein
MTRPEGDILKDAAAFAQRDLAFSAAVQIVKYGARYAALGALPQVGDIDGAREAR